MPIERTDIKDSNLEGLILEILTKHGYAPRKSGDLIILDGVGVNSGDNSVSVALNVVALDGHRIIEFKTVIPTKHMNFEKAVLVAAYANLNSITVKFKPIEVISENVHQIQASMVIYGDELAPKEISSMLYLFLKEVDELDNELIKQSGSLIK